MTTSILPESQLQNSPELKDESDSHKTQTADEQMAKDSAPESSERVSKAAKTKRTSSYAQDESSTDQDQCRICQIGDSKFKLFLHFAQRSQKGEVLAMLRFVYFQVLDWYIKGVQFFFCRDPA